MNFKPYGYEFKIKSYHNYKKNIFKRYSKYFFEILKVSKVYE